jgi:aspartate/methionine/tyrosine aminotransferase
MMRSAFERRGQVMYKMLNEIDGVTALEPQGAFYCFPSFAGALGRSFGGRTANTTIELAEIILEQAEVALVPGEAFGAPGYMRLSFALSDADLVEGVGRVADLLGRKG